MSGCMELSYDRLTSDADADISVIVKELDKTPYLSYNKENYWRYVTESDGVYYYKVFCGVSLVGTLHLENYGAVLSVAVLVFESHRKQGIGAKILADVIGGAFTIAFETVEASIDKDNTASISLFEKAGFSLCGKDGELLEYQWNK